jgi:hypothetical protein
MLIQPHSKTILRDGIKSDSEFLSRSNIMDYSYVYLLYTFFKEISCPSPFLFILSLLLGVDEEKKEIACGLVDTIGITKFAITLAKKTFFDTTETNYFFIFLKKKPFHRKLYIRKDARIQSEAGSSIW